MNAKLIEKLKSIIKKHHLQVEEKPADKKHKPPELLDKWFCEFFENGTSHIKIVGFYDVVHECAYSNDGKRQGRYYDNVVPIPRHLWPEWAVEAQKTLED